jgi:hypothetical protein
VAQHAFWIIVDGHTPTSFRSRQREDLLPTLHQLQRKQPQVTLMWFERGRLWPSPTEAREALLVRRRTPTGRTRQWRPGGEHADPRAKYDMTRDQKRARFKARLGRDRSPDGPPWTPPPPDQDRSRPPSDRPKPPSDRPRPPFDPQARRSSRPPSGPTTRPSSGGFDRRPPARSRERTGGREERYEAPPRKAEAERKPKGFGDRPWRPKGPWKPKKGPR